MSLVVPTSFGTFVNENCQHFLKTIVGTFVPFEEAVEKVSKENAKRDSKKIHLQQESESNVDEICIPVLKPNDDWNIHFERLEQFFNINSVHEEVRN